MTSLWPMALLCAGLSTLLFAGLSFLARERTRATYIVGGVNFVLVYILSWCMFYLFMPTFQGTLGGFYWPAFITIVPAVVLGLLTNGEEQSGKGVVATIATTVVLLVVVPIGQIMWSSFGPGNAQRFAALANVTTVQEDILPPTDPNMMVQVTKSVAAFKGQTALTSDKTQNLGSRFYVDPESYVLQAVAGHRYWIAPLRFANSGDSFWGPLMGNLSESPGYVVVDAQNPFKDAWVKLGYHTTIIKDGAFSNDLGRFLYRRGYMNVDLYEAKFEVDDEWRPHWIVTFVRYPFEGVAGKVIDKVVVVDVSESEPKVSEFELGKEPKWVERAMPQSLIDSYLKDWGYWNNDYAKQNPWKAFFGFRKDQSTQPVEYDMNYTTDDHSVWVVPMSSMNNSDHAVTGVVVYETTGNEAKFYPNIRGFNEGATVQETIANSPVFLGKSLGVENPQLYSIYGELTWVSIVTNAQSTGKGYAGVALLSARGQNASDVVFAPDMNRALGQYANLLARRGSRTTGDVNRLTETKELSGRVLAIGIVPGNVQQPNQWVFMIEGDGRTFTLGRDTYVKIPMVEKGDKVTFSYLELAGNELAVSSFRAERLEPTSAK